MEPDVGDFIEWLENTQDPSKPLKQLLAYNLLDDFYTWWREEN